MISEIVEAAPEQLRNHLEEAAGISKYKERRKETESRIKATRENLDRVRDVRDEVDKQLEHLKRQARAAERWQGYKNEQKKKEAELKALSLRAAQSVVEGHSAELRKAELAIEQQVAEQRHVEAELETGREKHTGSAEHLNKVQSEVYRIGAEIARVEQQIQHHKELSEQLQRAREETERAHAELAAHISDDSARHEEVQRLLAEAEPKVAELHAADEQAAEAVRVAEAKIGDWQGQWDAHANTSSQAAQSAEVERTRLDYLDRQLLQADQRRAALDTERGTANLDELGQALASLDEQHVGLRGQVDALTQGLEERRSSAEGLLERERAVHTALSAKRGELESVRGRLASLEALQHAALGETGAAATEWLQRTGLGNPRRLGEALQVDAGWERAVETVLDGWLEAALIDDPQNAAAELASLREADLTLMASTADTAAAAQGTLAAFVEGPAVARQLLARVRTASSLDEARSLAIRLTAGESVVTPAGEWLGAGFARVQRGAGSQVGVIAREREIRELTARVRELEGEVAGHIEAAESGKRERVEAEQARDDAQRELYTAHRRLAEISGQLQSQRGRIDSAQERMARIAQELGELEQKIASDREQAREARTRLEASVGARGTHASRSVGRTHERARTTAPAARQRAAGAARSARRSAHECARSGRERAPDGLVGRVTPRRAGVAGAIAAAHAGPAGAIRNAPQRDRRAAFVRQQSG